MKTRDRILELLADGEARSASELAGLIGLSRQAVSRHLAGLIAAGRVLKAGVTRGARFRLSAPGERGIAERRFSKRVGLRGLEEDLVFREIAALLDLRRQLNPAAFSIAGYAFTEILNNAIDHSRSSDCKLEFITGPQRTHFTVRDFGVGAFHSIREKFGLRDEDAAVAEILKGKATSMAERHTGMGIFFTSKAADRFVLRSHRTVLTVTSSPPNTIVEQRRFLKGTEVTFAVSSRTRRSMAKLFEEYAPEEFDFKFARTRLLVNLCRPECVSRSEAKRLVARLEEFSEVALDFRGVKSLGQAFADEVFRVFLQASPGTRLQVENLLPGLRPMIEGALTPRTAERVSWGA